MLLVRMHADEGIELQVSEGRGIAGDSDSSLTSGELEVGIEMMRVQKRSISFRT